MSRRKTQVDRAIESLEAEIAALRDNFDYRRIGLESAIDKLRDQQDAKPTRKSRTPKGAASV